MPETLLSVVIAVYNESPYNLHTLIERLEKILVAANISYELVFVNDGSREETSNCLKELCERYSYVKLINLSRNFGQQAAISAGINFSSGQAIVNIDSDLQDPPELIPDMVKLWQRGFEVVYAKRSSRKDRVLKRFTAFIYYRVLTALSNTQIPEDTGEFRLIDQRVAKALQLLPERTRYLRGLIPWLGFKQTTIPINRNAREHGESNYTLRKLISLALDGILCFSYAPLYCIATVGMMLMAFGLILPAILFVFSHASLSAMVWVISCLAILSGLQIMLTGVIGLYIARIFDEVRARPVYVVSELLGEPFASSSMQRIPQRERNYRSSDMVGMGFDNKSRLFSRSDKLNFVVDQNKE